MLLTPFFLIFAFSTSCYSFDVQYQNKLMSGKANDWFGRSLATNDDVLVVGAPLDDNYAGTVAIYDLKSNGSNAKVILKSPGGTLFGFAVAVNKDYIVVTSQGPTYAYVYSTKAPYPRVTYWQVGYWYEPSSVTISDNHTVAVAASVYSDHSTIINIYNHVTGNTWKYDRYMWYQGGADLGELAGVSMFKNTLAGGIPGSDAWTRRVHLYQHNGAVWKELDSLSAHQDVWYYGNSIMLHENTLVASARTYNGSKDLVFVYKFDVKMEQWVEDGVIVPPGAPKSGSMVPAGVALGNDMVLVTVSDQEIFPDVVAVIYKRAEEEGKVRWSEHTALKTEGQPLLRNQYNTIVRCQGSRVFVTRTERHGLGAVFMFDLSDVKSKYKPRKTWPRN